jgi:hypothetical protein
MTGNGTHVTDNRTETHHDDTDARRVATVG